MPRKKRTRIVVKCDGRKFSYESKAEKVALGIQKNKIQVVESSAHET